MHSTADAVILRHLCALYGGALCLELFKEPGVDEARITSLPLRLVAGHLSPTDAALHSPGAPLATLTATSAAPLLRQF